MVLERINTNAHATFWQNNLQLTVVLESIVSVSDRPDDGASCAYNGEAPCTLCIGHHPPLSNTLLCPTLNSAYSQVLAVTSVVYEVKQPVTSVVFKVKQHIRSVVLKVKQAITSVVLKVKQAVTSVHTFQVLGICRLSPFHLSAGRKYGK